MGNCEKNRKYVLLHAFKCIIAKLAKSVSKILAFRFSNQIREEVENLKTFSWGHNYILTNVHVGASPKLRCTCANGDSYMHQI